MKEAARKEGNVRELPAGEVPTCPILGVRIAAIDMKTALAYIQEHLRELSGNYICISNVHTTVTSYEDAWGPQGPVGPQNPDDPGMDPGMEQPAGFPWFWVIGGVVVVAAGVFVYLKLRKNKKESVEEDEDI